MSPKVHLEGSTNNLSALAQVTVSDSVAPVEYERDTNNLKGTFTKLNISLTEKLTTGALVSPTPEQIMSAWLINQRQSFVAGAHH